MNSLFNCFLIAAAVGTAALVEVDAASYSTKAGTAYEGEIYKIAEGVVTIDTGSENIDVALADLDDASQAAAKTWASEHPEAVDVYTKWDEQPKIKSSALPQLPEAFAIPNFAGMVSVDLVLNESGQVIYASVKKSTHPELEEPSLVAAKTWIFEPAKIGGKPVKSKLRVPFKFTFTPPAAPPAG